MTPHVLMRRAGSIAALIALVALPATGHAQSYPRLGLYGSISGDGTPYTLPSGALDPVPLDAVARYHEVILDASPITEYRPDIAAALRARNPQIKLYAYLLGHMIWDVAAPDSFVHIPTRYRRLVRDLDGFLYNKAGQEFSGFANVNLAKKDAFGRFVVAEGLADLFTDAVVATGIWDGIFIDVFCSDIAWAQTPTDSIDFVRAGYPSFAAFDVGWHAGADTLADRLRRRAGPSVTLIGNCGGVDHLQSFNGWMVENFPLQNGGNWYENLLKDPGGYFANDRDYRAPAHNYLFTASAGADPTTATNRRKLRFGLGSAALGQGYGVFGPGDRSWRSAPYHLWWFDEYAVDLGNGRSTGNLQNTGWLGAPVGGPYQMVWAGTGPDAVSNSDLESDASGWTMWSGFGASATMARDATTAGRGGASLRVTIGASATPDWSVTLATTTALGVSAGQACAATFRARASSPRTVTVSAGATGGGTLAVRGVAIDTTWRQYQAVLVPSASGSAKLQFFLGLDAGTVWLDDLHLQNGVTSVWRRDFQNGVVLVNPAATSMTVPMGNGYRHLLGTADPLVNDGSVALQATVPASDALFLLSGDVMRPAAVRDLHVVP